MELLTGDRQIPNSDDFPHHITPFPATGNLFVSNPTAVIHSSPSLPPPPPPPQKLRPIRGSGTASSPSKNLPPPPTPSQLQTEEPGGLDGSLDKLGVLVDQMCSNGGGVGEYLKSPQPEGDAAVNGGEGSVRVVGSGIGGADQEPNFEGGLLDDESSSSSDDDDDDDDDNGNSSAGVEEAVSRKRKRKTRQKLEDFLENLVMKVMVKQEQMHKQLVETIERRERERMKREEAWRQQEMERMKRDEEVRAQEISRSLALISFIQNVMGHGIEVPQPLTEISHVENIGGIDRGNTPVQKDLKCDPHNNRWPEAEIQALIMLRAALDQKFRVMGSKSSSVWDEISAGMYNMGYSRTAKKCKEKWENMNKYFKKTLGSGDKKRYENGKTCPYFHELSILYKNGIVHSGNASYYTNNESKSNSGAG